MIISTKIKGVPLSFETGDYYFSPGSVDKGTLFMLSCVDFASDDKVLDLGCGYGPVGILAAKTIGAEKVILCDISDDAVRLSKENLSLNGISGVKVIKSDGFSDISDNDFTLILSNPPYHTDFSVARGFIEDGFNKLAVGGRLLMVTKRKDWYKNKIISVFGGVRIKEEDGYFVFEAQKRGTYPAPRKKAKKEMSRKLMRKLRRGKGNASAVT